MKVAYSLGKPGHGAGQVMLVRLQVGLRCEVSQQPREGQVTLTLPVPCPQGVVPA